MYISVLKRLNYFKFGRAIITVRVRDFEYFNYMYSYFVTAFSCLKQLEKAEKQALLLEQSAKELTERQEREKQLRKLIEEKEV